MKMPPRIQYRWFWLKIRLRLLWIGVVDHIHFCFGDCYRITIIYAAPGEETARTPFVYYSRDLEIHDVGTPFKDGFIIRQDVYSLYE